MDQGCCGAEVGVVSAQGTVLWGVCDNSLVAARLWGPLGSRQIGQSGDYGPLGGEGPLSAGVRQKCGVFSLEVKGPVKK